MKHYFAVMAIVCGLIGNGIAAEVAGAKFDDRAHLGSADLVLNGAGVRSKLFFKLYAVGLYLSEKKSASADVLAHRGARRVQIIPLRDVTAEQFLDAMMEGMRKNLTEAEMEPLKARIEQLSGIILALKNAAKSTVIQIDWLPETGTRLSVGGEKKGEDIAGEDFYRALLKIWLGERPAQDDLKEALLGK